jgi:ligand-binding sensor domain-containing protein
MSKILVATDIAAIRARKAENRARAAAVWTVARRLSLDYDLERARFDGVRFTLYNTSTHPDLASNRLTTIRESSDGSLWLSTEQHHLVRFQDGRFTTETSTEVHCLYREPDGTFWAGGNTGVSRWSRGQWERIAPDLIRVRVLAILRDRAGELWFGTSFAGVQRLARGKLTTWYEREGLPRGEVLALLETTSGDMLAGTTDGLFRKAGDRWERVELEAGRVAVHAIDEGDAGQLWLRTTAGVLQQDGSRFRLQTSSAPWIFRRDRPFRRDRDGVGWANTGNELRRGEEPVFTSSDVITSTFHDREGNAWIGTWRSGLYRIRKSRFTIYGKDHGLISENLYPIEPLLADRRAH